MKNVKLFREVYAFTNWGLVKGDVVEVIESGFINEVEKLFERNPFQYKLQIYTGRKDVDPVIEYDFMFTADQLFESPEDAIASINIDQ